MSNQKNPNDEIDREILLDSSAIKTRIKELGNTISKDYQGKQPIFIGILKGSVVFFADLIRELDADLQPEIDFMEVSSYFGTESSGIPDVKKDVTVNIKDRNIIIVEDIVDNGYCISAVLEHLSVKNPSSIKICALLSKPSRRKIEVLIDYLGFEIADKWVEGYGLDTDQQNRHLPDIWYRKSA